MEGVSSPPFILSCFPLTLARLQAGKSKNQKSILTIVGVRTPGLTSPFI